jgi:hypothetical protein
MGAVLLGLYSQMAKKCPREYKSPILLPELICISTGNI